ncbi:amino acid adenylation domain-containing protein [Streptomyces sp. LP11]|uniref:Amino acid adenylation domain-containing protein n=1 Tax=Streptomyces pyxinicus TaxID=2970331 RepID=A0ABT2B5L8_9ACTN|nr:non-ribosomal peptide synthetase [Streptomyces sp. LP11]MCS0603725.1 amino acid adenylation domain-containing protein [Streptomyces sp. LP11]
MRHEDVAIIGAAGLFPGADGLDDFHRRLRTGYDGIAPPTAERVRLHDAPPGDAYLPLGYLDRIDLFDHAFFRISRREAELMDPHQRLVLQLSHQAVESAGYAPGRLRGSRTAVCLAHTDSLYDTLCPGDDPQQILGTLSAATAARVAYLLDLVGPALVVDTACSSALAAVAQAVRALRCGEADLALAGGVSVQTVLTVRDDRETLRGIESPSGSCRPFDARADGTVGGEGGGIVLLKPLRRALADGDPVLAVLKGIAVNHNGYRAASMGAPSQRAQTEVIAAAWRDADIDPRTVGYVECHGSATPLGDVVEADALRLAFLDAGVDTPSCVIGSVKGDIGHLGNAAGIVGLLKALGALRSGVLPALAHFTEPNPLIDFDGPLRLRPAGGPWPGADGLPRRAGVSSFGLTGTNVHAVLEQAPDPLPAPPPPSGAPDVRLVTVSAKSVAALDRYRTRLADFAAGTAHDLRTLAHVLNRGRDDHPHRLAVTAADPADLARALRSAPLPAPEDAAEQRPVVLLFSPDAVIPAAEWAELAALEPALATVTPPSGTASRGETLLRQLALHRLLESWGLTGTQLVGRGTDAPAVRAVRGEMSTEEAARAADAEEPAAVDPDRLRRAVGAFRAEGAVLVEMGADGMLSRALREAAPDLPLLPLLAGAGTRGLLERFGRLYALGATVDWERHYRGTAIPRIAAPTYPFDPVRCWPRPPEGVSPATGRTTPRTSVPEDRRPPAPGRGAAETERLVAAVWQDVLGTGELDSEADYFALGGTSIAGISVLRRLEHDLGVTLTFADLYAHRTVRALAAHLAGRQRSTEASTERRTIPSLASRDRLPLSYGQEQLWYLDRLHPPGPLYNIPADLRLRGPLDADALRGALADLAARHEVLRVRVRDEEGEPYAEPLPAGPDLTLVDLTTLPPAERESHAVELAHEEALRPFDLSEGPLLRTSLLRLADDDHVLLYTHHHIVFDGWSPSVFFRDLFALYRTRTTGAPAQLPELPIQYADFAAWQRTRLSGERLAADLDFWRAELAGLTTRPLPLDRPRPDVQDVRGAMAEFTVDAPLAARVRAYSRAQGVTTFVTMLALVDAALYRWAGMTDVVVGVGTSGRTEPATHELIGYFNNLPPFRTRVEGPLAFGELVRRCAATVAGVLDHEDMPFEKIVSAVCRHREPGRHPVYDVAYTYQNAPAPALPPGDLRLSRLLDSATGGIAPGTAKFDLTVGVTDQDDGPLHGYLEYALALFDHTTMTGLADWLPRLLDAALEDPGRPLDSLPAPPLARPGPPAVLVGAEPAPRDERLVGDLVRRQAARHPDRPAVVTASGTHTYAEIDAAADRLARALNATGAGPGSLVPVVADRGPDLVVGWLGVVRAGAAFLPLDPAWPRGRIEDVLDSAGIPASAPVVGRLPGRRCLPVRPAEPGGGEDTVPVRRPGPGDLAYVVHTSGSTGRPHGCEIPHAALLDLVLWYQDAMELTGDDRVAQTAAPGFDAAVLEIWSALCAGATLHFPPTALEEPGAFLRRLAEDGVTAAFLPTRLAETVLTECAWPRRLRLRVLATGGDRLRVRPPADCPFRLLNMYGPAECTVVATAGVVEPDGTTGVAGPDGTTGVAALADLSDLPGIGRPVTGASVYLLDGHGAPVAAGETGEITIGGRAVGRGYRALPGLTARRFTADPFASEPGNRMYRTGDLGRLRPDGTIEFRGRLDDQIEIHGQRMEPAETERVLLTHPSVHGAVVLPAPGPGGTVRLTAHVATGHPAPSGESLRQWARLRLPAFMVPRTVVRHDRLPLTATGKLDRALLRRLDHAPLEETAVPNTPTALANASPDTYGTRHAEEVLTRVVAELLGSERVRPDDNFFDLGGDSVLGVRVAARAARSGVHFTPQQLLQHHSLRELAAAASVTTPTTRPADTSGTGSGRAEPEPVPLTPIMRTFLDRMPPGAPDFADAHLLEISARVGAEGVRAAVAHLLARHEPLRYHFPRNTLGWRIERAEPGAVDVYDSLVLPPLDPAAERAFLTADLARLKALVDLERGPALRVRYYDRGHGRPAWVVLLIHHFVFDNMSTVVLIDELDTLLGELAAGRPLPAPVPVPTWPAWSRHLTHMASSDELAGELAYWTSVLESGARSYPVGDPPFGGRPAGGAVQRTVAADQVAPVLRGGPDAEPAAMTAFACALARRHGTHTVSVMTEGRAEPNVFRPAGPSPAIGWFTTLHPLTLSADPGADVLDALASVTDTVRSVPNDGVGYGILRHLSPRSPGVDRLRALPEPAVLVIHGTHDGSGFDTGVRLLRARRDLTSGAPRLLPGGFPLVLTSTVTEGALRLVLLYDDSHTEKEAGALADETVRAFTELAG